MTNETEDCGCNSSSPSIEAPVEKIEDIKNKMAETKDTLSQMLDTVNGLNFDVSKFANFEEEVKKVSEYMYSGEFVNAIEKMLQNNAQISPTHKDLYKNYSDAKQNHFGTMFGGFDPEQMEIFNKMSGMNKTETKPKTPIGYVYIDESGEQRFSPTKPEGISSSAVYGE